MIVEFQNCSLKLKWIGTSEELMIRKWCHKKSVNYGPLKKPGHATSKSPNKNLLDDHLTSVRWCLTCSRQTLFTYKIGDKHSKCSECGKTHSSRGKLRTKMNKVFYPGRI